jgi:hypothetical protein
MTARERLNHRPALFPPHRRRAPARIGKVRSNSDINPHDTPPKMQNKPASRAEADVRAAANVTPRPCNALTSLPTPIENP